ncbi:hypothetical protein JD844_013567 [Phrynosoma platyrhinos]|uniref:Uncharacterized protein n=1 Tax=Phrynosoma platyrhinos TaxID=52577 RepID=A0ABQ7TMA5_PHRPL|nr:hypothetical protein JD844_013567 [Phrynosoma platyrhinos]
MLSVCFLFLWLNNLVVVLGKSNMGGSPKKAVDSIEDLVNVRANRKDYLGESSKPVFIARLPVCFIHSDIYAFGVGNLEVDWSAMNEIASKKPGERHAFILKNPEELKMAFEDVLGGGQRRLPIKRRIDHELYNVRAKLAQGIQEFYDYDISLLELENPVRFGGRISTNANPTSDLNLLCRPICLPCTEGANKALKKKPGTTTCKDHGESGGSLFVERRERHFQVGVISWGTYDPCKRKKKIRNTQETLRDSPPRNHKPRDFYIGLIGVQDWLRKHLGKSLRFIPMQ